jgi:N-carbamoyl-L-amino-acid hydrolase
MRDIVPGRLAPEKILATRRDPANTAGFIELHIEQGPRLEAAGKPIGVVNAIYGRRSERITFYGRSDHAGTTPLHLRADALVAAASFVAQVSRIGRQRYPEAVITCGNVTVKPGVYNVVPNEATVWVEFRASSVDMLDDMELALRDLAEDSTAGSDYLSFDITPTGQHDPVQMALSIQSAIRQACAALSYPTMTLASGALHDAGVMATIAPSGMVFVPSIGGRSHSPDEDTDPADLVAGANTLLHTALILASQHEHPVTPG